jgi:hypothetical protein
MTLVFILCFLVKEDRESKIGRRAFCIKVDLNLYIKEDSVDSMLWGSFNINMTEVIVSILHSELEWSKSWIIRCYNMELVIQRIDSRIWKRSKLRLEDQLTIFWSDKPWGRDVNRALEFTIKAGAFPVLAINAEVNLFSVVITKDES